MPHQFQPKEQILYVPDHADGNLHHPDVEAGFVVRQTPSWVFCRYWSKVSQGELRTKANAEPTPARNLYSHDTVSDQLVEEMWSKYVEARDE